MATESGRATTAVNDASGAPPTDATLAATLVASARAGRAKQPSGPRSVAQRLWESPYEFDFFQAVRLIERLDRERSPVGYDGSPAAEAVRFRAQAGLNFPAAVISDLRPQTETSPPVMTVAFMGLTGPSGVLPRHYTDLMFRLERDSKHAEKGALAAWLDIFNHRLISLFYRSWEKYRFYVAFERGDHLLSEPDSFHQCVYSLLGIGMPSFRNRLQVRFPSENDHAPEPGSPKRENGATLDDFPRREDRPAPEDRLAHEETSTASIAPAEDDSPPQIPDLVLLYYSGLLAHRPRSAVGLQAMLADFFGMPVEVQQFRGQWARLDDMDRSRLDRIEGHCTLGEDVVLGERVWESESQFRICLGPLSLAQFEAFLPSRLPGTDKSFFLLCHLVRMYVGPTLDFDVRMTLAPTAVPMGRLGVELASRPPDAQKPSEQKPSEQNPREQTPGENMPSHRAGEGHSSDVRGMLGPRLGWNTWIYNRPFTRPADDAVFAGAEMFWLNDDARRAAPASAI